MVKQSVRVVSRTINNIMSKLYYYYYYYSVLYDILTLKQQLTLIHNNVVLGLKM